MAKFTIQLTKILFGDSLERVSSALVFCNPLAVNSEHMKRFDKVALFFGLTKREQTQAIDDHGNRAAFVHDHGKRGAYQAA